ncbi:MAG: DUF3592 domain-containing protein [Ruminococcus sp.]|nr:DUF3592 domain-containing protein [Ruminococcus sp.]
MIVGYSLIVGGIIFAGLALVIWYYGRLFSGELEEVEARLTSLRPMVSKEYDALICPEAEYSINGKLVKGHYYTAVLRPVVSAKVGDTVMVQVAPKHPKVFRIAEIEASMEMQNTKKNAPLVGAIGGGLIIAGIIVLIISMK